METGRYTEEELIALLENDREKGTVALWEAYSGLVWRICARRLSDPEDVKECVNDSFAAFVLNPQKFDPKKGTLKQYLCAIADHQALDLCRKNERRERAEEKLREQMAQEKNTPKEIWAEGDLEEILSRLEPLDGAILRMKYYGGLSFKEIAAQMKLPYETVKKRGQRSIKKLLKILLLGLLLAVLAGCAAMLFHRFQFHERTGFNWEESEPVYSLHGEKPFYEKDGITFIVTDAVYQSGELYLAFFASFPPGEGERFRFPAIADYYIGACKGEGISVIPDLGKSCRILEGGERVSCWFFWTPDESEEELSLSIRLDPVRENGEIPEIALYDENGRETGESYRMEGEVPCFDLTLSKLRFEEDLSALGQTVEYSGGSLLIQPGRKSGEGALISLYSLSEREGYPVSPFLTQSSRGTGNGDYRPAYLRDKAGREYPAQAVSDSTAKLARKELYIEGAEAGTYTLVLPCLCLEGEAETGKITLPLPTTDGEDRETEAELSFPGGETVRILHVKAEKKEREIRWEREGETWGERELYWQYTLTCEIRQGDKEEGEPLLSSFNAAAEFAGEAEDGQKRAGIGIRPENQVILTSKDERPQSEVTLYFHSPVYLLEEEIRAEVEIKP
ncbi:MAG: sigma-70 family RNA polymerase sigma factor [Lachnospiraceae bacterium]|nr:sigma-70 family RNA polymerase sigma factor [Lachnospiraceae bacterium]